MVVTNPTSSQPIDLFLSRIGEYRETPNGFECRCPAHDDRNASLSVSVGDDGRVLINCHAGCNPLSICDTLGLTFADLMPPKENRPKNRNKPQRGRIVATYDYRDETGNLLYQAVRLDPKDFRQRRPNGKNGWTWSVKGVRRVPYRLVELLAEPQRSVAIAEGENDVENLTKLGVLATCNVGGAGKWTEKESEYLRGRNVVIFVDNDDAGRKHGESVAKSLHGIAASVRIVALPGLPPKGDVSDWIAAGGTREQLRELAAAAPEWVPTPEKKKEESNTNAITNYCPFGDDEKLPIPMADILRQTREKTGDRPYRVGSSLFVDDEQHGVSWLEKTADLFGWLSSHAGAVAWVNGLLFVKQHEFFSEFRRTAKSYLAIEEMPHEPLLADHYYRCGTIEPGNGDTLQRLLDRFCCLTPIDRDLLLAAIVTPCWGGPFGARPAFGITSPFGRGMGKTALVKGIGLLWGGILSFASGDDTAKMQTRLLSPDAMAKRIAVLDNIKSMKFSWATWEAMLTAASISGHRMYAGEAMRPNTLTWFLTVNNASLSTDIAQRVVTISLDRPNRSGTWEEDTAKFIEQNRKALIADCIGFLRSDRIQPLDKFSRWGAWEKDILQRLPNPNEAQRVILERQQESDVESEEAGLIEEYFGSRLDDLHYTPEVSRVFIPSGVMVDWFVKATGERNLTTMSVCKKIYQLIDEGQLPRINRNPCNAWGRGVIWHGSAADAQDAVCTDIEERLHRHNPPTNF